MLRKVSDTVASGHMVHALLLASLLTRSSRRPCTQHACHRWAGALAMLSLYVSKCLLSGFLDTSPAAPTDCTHVDALSVLVVLTTEDHHNEDGRIGSPGALLGGLLSPLVHSIDVLALSAQ